MSPRPAGGVDTSDVWAGGWVANRLGVRIESRPGTGVAATEDLVGLALRHNARRAHLLVSRVLGKHVPADPRLVRAAGLLLGELVRRCLAGEPAGTVAAAAMRQEVSILLREALAGAHEGAVAALSRYVRDLCAVGQVRPGSEDTLVIGFAETATGLGHCVAEALQANVYLHSTRREVRGVPWSATFEEGHSHASRHLLQPSGPALLRGAGPVVLVDDELSTGNTVWNTVELLQRLAPRSRYVVATLCDLRSDTDRDRLSCRAADAGIQLDVVSLAGGRVHLPATVLRDGADLVRATVGGADRLPGTSTPRTDASRTEGRVARLDIGWPAGLLETARHGFTWADQAHWDRHMPQLGARLAGALRARLGAPRPGQEGPRQLLVLGHEELMAAPLRLASEAAEVLAAGPRGDVAVHFSTTTRSPVLAVNDPDYAIRTRLVFPAHDEPSDGPGDRFAYNVFPPRSGPVGRFDAVVLLVDAAADTAELCGPAGLLDQLAMLTDLVLLVVLPCAGLRRPVEPVAEQLPEPLHGPQFGSYGADEVSWLLKGPL